MAYITDDHEIIVIERPEFVFVVYANVTNIHGVKLEKGYGSRKLGRKRISEWLVPGTFDVNS